MTLDYPLLKSICTLKGVDAIYEYICSVKMEQKFLEKFQREYVITVLKAAVPDYKRGMENICSILLMNTVGHLAVGKPLSDRGFTKEEYTKLEKIFSGNSVGGTEDILRHVIEEMIAQVYENDEELLAYLQCGRKNMAVRIETAIRNGYLEKLFVR